MDRNAPNDAGRVSDTTVIALSELRALYPITGYMGYSEG